MATEWQKCMVAPQSLLCALVAGCTQKASQLFPLTLRSAQPVLDACLSDVCYTPTPAQIHSGPTSLWHVQKNDSLRYVCLGYAPQIGLWLMAAQLLQQTAPTPYWPLIP